MKLLFNLIFSIFLVSCGNLPVDTVPSPIDNNLYQVEMESCKKAVGLLGCTYDADTDLSQKYLVIPVAYSGEYLVRSTRCSFNQNRRFQGVNEIKIPYSELLLNRGEEPECLYDVKIFVDGFEKGFKGIFRLVDLEEFKPAKASFLGREGVGTLSVQIRTADVSPTLPIVFEDKTPGTLIAQGCTKSIEFKYEKNPELRLEDLIDPSKVKTCNYTIALFAEGKAEIFSLMISQYDKKTTPLLLPVISHGRWFMKINVEGSVAVIQAGNKRKVFNCGTFRSCQPNGLRSVKVRYYKDITYWIRYYTKAGRAMVVAYRNGEFIWKPDSILY